MQLQLVVHTIQVSQICKYACIVTCCDWVMFTYKHNTDWTYEAILTLTSYLNVHKVAFTKRGRLVA